MRTNSAYYGKSWEYIFSTATGVIPYYPYSPAAVDAVVGVVCSEE